jgi:hypothetical protein
VDYLNNPFLEFLLRTFMGASPCKGVGISALEAGFSGLKILQRPYFVEWTIKGPILPQWPKNPATAIIRGVDYKRPHSSTVRWLLLLSLSSIVDLE